ncbi:coatomer WD associated region-domain-containing protein [Paraphysoderma sedebokerense]|nr:coatomer WD associated region-domain-containing protein [Paraphysoderma sedebokerense]
MGKMRIDIKRKFTARSDRVKSVDLHPTEPWFLASLYNGTVYVYNHETQALVKTFEVTDLPVRAAKFIARKSWLICGCDDYHIRVFNYNTHEKVTAYEAHSDYIRSLAVHPTQSLVLSSSDDMTIKLWDWEKGWKNLMVFEGHTHYVMQVVFNPKDSNTFASASLDKTIKVWSLGSSVPNYTLEGHEKGVNCVDYYQGGDKPYLVSGADDRLVKIWDYQNKTCVQTLEGHTQNVTLTVFHPELPLIVSGGEDGAIKIWHANTYRLEHSLNYGLERAWCVTYYKGMNDIAVGFDEGCVVVKLGREEPAVSMDSSGKVIWAKHNEILTANVKVGVDESVKDGEKIPLPVKELGTCELYAQSLLHSPNGRFVVVCGDGEYIVYTALAWRNKSYGSAVEFAWSPSNEYAIRESTNKIKLFDKQFKEKPQANQLHPPVNYSSDALFSGALLGVKSAAGFLSFYDWDSGLVVRRIEVSPKNVVWSDSGELVAILCEDTFYVLRFKREEYEAFVGSGMQITDEGVEAAFEFLHETEESVKTGCWVGDCFIYTSNTNRLNYLVGGQVFTIAHADFNMYLLGYIPKDNRIYLADKDVNVFSYVLPVTVIEYQTAILRHDMEMASRLLPDIPADQKNKIARFLEGQGLQQLALNVTTDIEHKFDLSIQLNQLDIAYQIAEEVNTESKWKLVAEVALNSWQFALAEKCMNKAGDIEGLLLFHTSSGNVEGMKSLAKKAVEAGKNNVAFIVYFVLGQVEECIELLRHTDRIPEAALLAKTYLPSKTSEAVQHWRETLIKSNKSRIASSIADPAEHPSLFPDFKYALTAEEIFKSSRNNSVPATNYSQVRDHGEADVVADLKQQYPGGIPSDFKQSGYKMNGIHDDDGNSSFATSSDNYSMEVNTTGTGSVRGFDDFEDLLNMNSADASAHGASGAGGNSNNQSHGGLVGSGNSVGAPPLGNEATGNLDLTSSSSQPQPATDGAAMLDDELDKLLNL